MYPQKMYIYELPYLDLKACCNILDENHLWKVLGGKYMNYDNNVIKGIEREIMCGNSPTESLLELWGNQNHYVVELFELLSRMKNYRAMTVLKKFVSSEYHCLIKESKQCPTREVNKLNEYRNQDCRRDVSLVPEIDSEKILNVPREQLHEFLISNENNESRIKEIPKPRSPHLAPHVGRNSNVLTVSGMSCAIDMPHIPYEDLERSTNNWSSAILGKGGFGTVFKGTWKNTQVAIKRIERKENSPEAFDEQMRQSMTELCYLNKCRHDNILSLYGYSSGGPQPCLVYQLMPGGCLEKRLRVTDPLEALDWPTRLDIAVGSARGLQFLHTSRDKPLIHGDIKSANILLDTNNSPRIGDFGLAREGPLGEYTRISKIHGTRPYLPHEFVLAGKFSTKVDTYSFGIVLFEIATGLAAYSSKRPNKYLKDHVVDYAGDILNLKDELAVGAKDVFTGLIDIGKLCVNETAKKRPEMVDVFKKLELLV